MGFLRRKKGFAIEDFEDINKKYVQLNAHYLELDAKFLALEQQIRSIRGLVNRKMFKEEDNGGDFGNSDKNIKDDGLSELRRLTKL